MDQDTASTPQTPAEPQPQQEGTPDWNTPKPLEDELNKYSGGKGLKIFLILGLVVIVTAIGLLVYKTFVKGITPAQQIQRQETEQPAEKSTKTEAENATAEEQMNQIDQVNLNEMDTLIEEIDTSDLDL